MEIKGYITNLGKYNEGELVGRWITFPIDEDGLQDILKDIGCCYYNEKDEYINTGYEEFFFTDWECGFINSFGEYEDIEFINEVAVNILDWDEDTIAAAAEIWDLTEVLEDDPNNYYLYKDVNSDYDLGYYWVEESGCYNTKDLGPLANYIDYEGFGRDLQYDLDGGFSSYGWIERSR